MSLPALVARHAFWPMHDLMTKNPYQRVFKNVKKVLQLPLREQREYQLNRIRRLCEHANQTTAFYKRRFTEMGLKHFSKMTFSDFEEIPPLRKKDIRDSLQELRSNKFSENALTLSATGGTTSAPTKFYLDKSSIEHRWGATAVFESTMGFLRGDKKAYIWGAEHDFPNQTLRKRIRNFLFERSLFLPASPLNEKSFSKLESSLRKFRPDYLQAYPSALHLFANYLNERSKPLPIPIVAVTAEPLASEAIDPIRRAFGSKPFEWYGARELGRIANECHVHNGMHINSYGLFAQIEGKSSTDGAGFITVTDLWNYGMPIIRYRNEDLGTMEDAPCICGCESPRIMKVVGRMADCFVNTQGSLIPGISFVNRVIRDNLEVKELQFIQHTINQFEVLVVPGSQWSHPASAETLTRSLESFLNEKTDTSITLVESIPRESSGKLLLCKSLL